MNKHTSRAMNNYELRLLLEALTSTYSLEDLEAGGKVESLLSSGLRFSLSQAKALVEGAALLKEVRAFQTDSFEIVVH
jgi:hypothetical protein